MGHPVHFWDSTFASMEDNNTSLECLLLALLESLMPARAFPSLGGGGICFSADSASQGAWKQPERLHSQAQTFWAEAPSRWAAQLVATVGAATDVSMSAQASALLLSPLSPSLSLPLSLSQSLGPSSSAFSAVKLIHAVCKAMQGAASVGEAERRCWPVSQPCWQDFLPASIFKLLSTGCLKLLALASRGFVGKRMLLAAWGSSPGTDFQ